MEHLKYTLLLLFVVYIFRSTYEDSSADNLRERLKTDFPNWIQTETDYAWILDTLTLLFIYSLDSGLVSTPIFCISCVSRFKKEHIGIE